MFFIFRDCSFGFLLSFHDIWSLPHFRRIYYLSSFNSAFPACTSRPIFLITANRPSVLFFMAFMFKNEHHEERPEFGVSHLIPVLAPFSFKIHLIVILSFRPLFPKLYLSLQVFWPKLFKLPRALEFTRTKQVPAQSRHKQPTYPTKDVMPVYTFAAKFFRPTRVLIKQYMAHLHLFVSSHYTANPNHWYAHIVCRTYGASLFLISEYVR